MSITLRSTLPLAFVVLVGCGVESSSARARASVSGQRCLAAGGSVDSTFAVEQARRAMAEQGLKFEPLRMQAISDEGIELGLLVTLALSEPRSVLGGGGLVWVDLETGCATVLRRYE